MTTILYRIPNKYFPAVFVKKPFHAKVNYDVKNGVVGIFDVAFSALCLKHITETDKLIEEMRDKIEAAETKRVANNNVHPVIMNAIAPHAPFITT
jgi:hypothetical protein